MNKRQLKKAARKRIAQGKISAWEVRHYMRSRYKAAARCVSPSTGILDALTAAHKKEGYEVRYGAIFYMPSSPHLVLTNLSDR